MRRLIYAAGWAVLTVLAGTAVWWGLSPLLSSSGPWFARQDPPAASSPAVPGSTPPLSTSPPNPPKTTTPKPPATGTATPYPSSSPYDGWAYSNGVFTRSFDMLGGTATVRIVGSQVQLVTQSPRPGYISTVEQPYPQRLVVRFYIPGGPASIIDAMWWDGHPYAELSEVK